MRNVEPEVDVEFGARRKTYARELLLVAVQNRAFPLSQDNSVETTIDSLATIQEKHPPND